MQNALMRLELLMSDADLRIGALAWIGPGPQPAQAAELRRWSTRIRSLPAVAFRIGVAATLVPCWLFT
jgi:hypothetical protein